MWDHVNPIDTQSNDMHYRILSPNKTVRTCLDCFEFTRQKFFYKLLNREITGRPIKKPERTALSADELYEWMKSLFEYVKQGDRVTYESLGKPGLNGLGGPIVAFYPEWLFQ